MSQIINNNINFQSTEILQEFIDAQAILHGHFLLSSGLHSDTYMQCAKVLMDTKRSEKLCKILAHKIIDKLGNNFADMVVSPAMGGVIVGYELSRHLNLPSIFCERVNGIFELRRGFEIPKNAKILVVEDVLTTGKSSLETFELIKKFDAKIVAEACLVNRAGDADIQNKLGVPLISLIDINIATYDENSLPESLKNIPITKPGSRFIK
jgi:orotate phosphoribosyltransferase